MLIVSKQPESPRLQSAPERISAASRSSPRFNFLRLHHLATLQLFSQHFLLCELFAKIQFKAKTFFRNCTYLQSQSQTQQRTGSTPMCIKYGKWYAVLLEGILCSPYRSRRSLLRTMTLILIHSLALRTPISRSVLPHPIITANIKNLHRRVRLQR